MSIAGTGHGTHEGHPRRWLILGVLIMALFGVSLDNTVLTIALPTLARDLHASTSELQWMVDAYILVFAGMLLLSGALSDRYGRRRMLLIGLVLFGLGSAVTPLVQTSGQLIALRAFMGLGAAFMMPSTLSIIGDVFAPPERPKAIAAWSSIAALGMVAGPLLGGWLLEHYAWPSVFVVNVPFVVLGIILTVRFIPESRSPEQVPLDLPGAALSVVGLTALIYAIIEVPGRGLADPAILLASAVAAVTIGAFAWWELHTAHPMLDMGLFRDRRFASACLSVTLVFFALNGALFFLTQYLQGVLGLSAFQTGIRFIPIALGVMAAAMVSATLTHRIGARWTTTIGLAAVGIGLGFTSLLKADSSDAFLTGIMLVVAAGMGLAMTPSTDMIMSALPAAQFGVGSAVNDTTREIGGALGVAVLGSLFAGSYATGMAKAAASLPTDVAKIVTDSFAGALAVAEAAGGAVGAVLEIAAVHAFIDAMGWTCVIGAVVALVGALIACIWMPARSQPAAPAVQPPPALEPPPVAVAPGTTR
ncbi:MAG: MFS transporter [Chloroflexota bacterium]